MTGTPSTQAQRRQSTGSDLSQADELPDLAAQRAAKEAARAAEAPHFHTNDMYDESQRAEGSAGDGDSVAVDDVAAAFEKQAAFEIGIASDEELEWQEGLSDALAINSGPDADGDAAADDAGAGAVGAAAPAAPAADEDVHIGGGSAAAQDTPAAAAAAADADDQTGSA